MDKKTVKKGRPTEKIIQPINKPFNSIIDAMLSKPQASSSIEKKA